MSFFDDNEDRIIYNTARLNNINNGNEFIDGVLKEKPDFKYTNNGKALCKVRIKNENEIFNIVAWEENAKILNELKKEDKIIIKGYRKYNDFLKKEEFIIKEFIKRDII